MTRVILIVRFYINLKNSFLITQKYTRFCFKEKKTHTHTNVCVYRFNRLSDIANFISPIDIQIDEIDPNSFVNSYYLNSLIISTNEIVQL